MPWKTRVGAGAEAVERGKIVAFRDRNRYFCACDHARAIIAARGIPSKTRKTKTHEQSPFRSYCTRPARAPSTVLEQYGWPVGTEVILESQDRLLAIRPQRPMPEAIFNLAATYLFEKVGDAVAAETPLWDGERWLVKVALPHQQKDLGRLFYSADGKLLPAESDSPARLEEKANEA